MTEDPKGAANDIDISLLSLEEPAPKLNTDSDGESPTDGAANPAPAQVQAVAVKQKTNSPRGVTAAALELPPIRKGNAFYDDEVVNDQRFSNLFESLTGNFFTDAFGRHPLIA